MKIVYYLNAFPKLSESFLLNEILELDRRGHKVAIFAHKNPEEDIKHEELKGKNLETYYSGVPEYSDLNHLINKKIFSKGLIQERFGSGPLKRRAKHSYYAIHLLKFVEQLDFEPDIIHTHFAFDDRHAVQLASRQLGIPWTIEVHAADIFKEVNKGPAKNVMEKSNRIITVSEYNKNYLQDEFRLEKSIDVVPVSVRPEKFQPQGLEEKNKIVSVGRLVEKKGFKYGIEAFAKLKEGHPDLQYNIVGKGPLKAELEELAEELQVADDVNFLGHVSDERLKTEMEEAKVFVLPCVKANNGDLDAMPMVLKEAMALKTPCVSTKVSAIPELIEDGKDGMLVDSHDANELSNRISMMLQGKDSREKIGKKAREKIEQSYDISKNIEDIEESFSRLIS
jgi:colanic acid/amylovoran biosynthesis glycosyltransferase